MTEVDLAARVVQQLRENGWDLFGEVSLGDGRSIDIVAVRPESDLCLAVECKTRFGLNVLMQAALNRDWANLSTIATPPYFGESRAFERAEEQRRVALTLVTALGIGWLSVPATGPMIELATSRVHRDHRAPLLDRCTEHHKTKGIIGSQHDRYSPWRETMNRVTAYVREHPGTTIRDMLAAGLETHYRTSALAARAITAAAKRGWVHEVLARFDGRRWRLDLRR